MSGVKRPNVEANGTDAKHDSSSTLSTGSDSSTTPKSGTGNKKIALEAAGLDNTHHEYGVQYALELLREIIATKEIFAQLARCFRDEEDYSSKIETSIQHDKAPELLNVAARALTEQGKSVLMSDIKGFTIRAKRGEHINAEQTIKEIQTNVEKNPDYLKDHGSAQEMGSMVRKTVDYIKTWTLTRGRIAKFRTLISDLLRRLENRTEYLSILVNPSYPDLNKALAECIQKVKNMSSNLSVTDVDSFYDSAENILKTIEQKFKESSNQNSKTINIDANEAEDENQKRYLAYKREQHIIMSSNEDVQGKLVEDVRKLCDALVTESQRKHSHATQISPMDSVVARSPSLTPQRSEEEQGKMPFLKKLSAGSGNRSDSEKKDEPSPKEEDQQQMVADRPRVKGLTLEEYWEEEDSSNSRGSSFSEIISTFAVLVAVSAGMALGAFLDSQ